MAQSLRIDFVSDIACPWCAVGLSSLQLALARLDSSVEVDLVMHPYELNPDMSAQGEHIVEYLGKKYGRTPEQIEQMHTMIRDRGASVGFEFGPRTHTYNTFDAHRLLHWARLEDKQVALKMALLKAYHTDGKNPGDPDVLVATAQSVGLDGAKAASILQSDAYAKEVRSEEREYMELGIQSVPAIILNRQLLINGGQPVETFERAIKQALEASQD